MRRDLFCKYLDDITDELTNDLSELKKAVEDNDANKVCELMRILRITCVNLPNRIQDCYTSMRNDQISRKIPHPH